MTRKVNFKHNLRVRWSEVDAQGVVFNPNYFMYADVAITEYMRHCGMLENNKHEFSELYVVNAQATYKASASFDDELDLYVNTDRLGNSSHNLKVDIFRSDLHLVEILITYVRAAGGTSKPLSENYTNIINTFEENTVDCST